MEDTLVNSVQGEHVAFKRLLWATPLAAVAATVGNAVLYFIASALGASRKTSSFRTPDQ